MKRILTAVLTFLTFSTFSQVGTIRAVIRNIDVLAKPTTKIDFMVGTKQTVVKVFSSTGGIAHISSIHSSIKEINHLAEYLPYLYTRRNGMLESYRLDLSNLPSEIYLIKDYQDVQLYNSLVETGNLQYNSNPYVSITDGLESIKTKYKDDQFAKNKDANEVLARLVDINRLINKGYLDKVPSNLNSLEYLDATIRSYYGTSYEQSMIRDFTNGYELQKEYPSAIREAHSYLVSMNIVPIHFVYESVIKTFIERFQITKKIPQTGNADKVTLEALKQESVEYYELTNLLNTLGKKPITNHESGKYYLNVVQKLLQNNNISKWSLMSSSIKNELTKRAYKHLIEKQSFTFNDTRTFIEQHYYETTPKYLTGYYSQNGTEVFISKNPIFKYAQLFAYEKKAGKVKLISLNNAIITPYVETVQKIASLNSSENLHISYISPWNLNSQTVTIQIGKQSLNVVKSEFLDYVNNKRPPPSALQEFFALLKTKSDVVIFRDLFLHHNTDLSKSSALIKNAYGVNTIAVNPLKILNKLQNDFQGHNYYLASDINVALLNLSRKPKDFNNYRIAKPSKSFNITDFSIMKVLYNHIEDNSKFITGIDNIPKDFDLLITVGHNDTKLAEYYRTLIEREVLKQKLVINYTCYKVNEEKWASNVIKKGETKGYVYFSEKIAPDAVKKAIIRYHELVKQENNRGLDVIDVIKKAIQDCQNDPKNEKLKKDLENLLQSLIYQLSYKLHYLNSKNVKYGSV